MLNECAKTLEAKLTRDNLLVGKESLREIKATRKTLHDGWQDTRSLSEEALREAKGLQRGVDHLAYTLTMDRVERNHTQTEFYNIIMNTIRTMQHDYECWFTYPVLMYSQLTIRYNSFEFVATDQRRSQAKAKRNGESTPRFATSSPRSSRG